MKARRGKFGLRLLSGAGFLSLSAVMSVAAAETTQYKIAPQPLGEALQDFGVQSGHPMIVDTELVRSKKSPGVVAAADPETALRKILEGTGLGYRRNGDIFAIVAEKSPKPVARIPQPVVAIESVTGSAVEGLVVTAQKRRENIQDVPIAISAFTQDKLEVSQIAGGPDLMTQVPNMTFTKTNFSSYSIQIRGIGTQAISATTDAAVAVAFNNTPFIRNHFFEQEFYDLERVEVLRGPQGTLYGRNATAGVVNAISAKPIFDFESKLSADVANYSSKRLEGMLNIPLVEDKAALRIAGAWTQRDGFVTNRLTGEQTDGRDLWSGRISFSVQPTDSIRADLIYEHFEENDDRLRSGKQLCRKDPGPSEISGLSVPTGSGAAVFFGGSNYLSQGCLPASMYGEESYQTPNGYSLVYYGAAGQLGAPVYIELDPYANATQSSDLRVIETHIKPEYQASSDVVELQLKFDLTPNLSLASETAFSRDYIFSFGDFNRFDTTPGVFVSGSPKVDANGFFCDPQLGCTNRLAAGDIATAKSQQFSQEFRLASNFDGPVNYNIGANFLRYDTEDKYYVFINSLTAAAAPTPWISGESDNSVCYESDPLNRQMDRKGYSTSDPNVSYELGLGQCSYIDPNDIHNLNDQGRNYFLSKNPYNLLSYAAFGEAYYQITPALKLTSGFRWTVDKKTAPQIPSWLVAASSYGLPVRKVIELEWSEPTGRLTVDWKPDLAFTDDTLFYASYVRGYKAGGANPPPPITVLYDNQNREELHRESLTHPETFDAEFVDAFEIGTKNTLFGGGLTANLGAFYYDYRGYQISQIVNRSAVNLNFDATVWGAEIELDWQPLENLRFGFKGGYEKTRMADGSQAVDLMDRTAGDPNWVVYKPFPPNPSNCIVPVWLVSWNNALHIGAGQNTSAASTYCEAYRVNVDPVTGMSYQPNPTQDYLGRALDPSWAGYPGWNPAEAPNNGEGFAKDLSGNELPNAPDFTATLSSDWTLPLPGEWLVTLHADLYYQSEAWSRIFNTDGYDKIKAYNNINLAAIFTNEDAGWNVMAYVKNALDRDSITGAFLNSDDTGLTTNVFLTEPRLYGVRVSKTWAGLPFWTPDPETFRHEAGTPYLYTLELGGYYGSFSQDHAVLAPDIVALFPAEHPYPLSVQNDIDGGSAGEGKFTWRPAAGWEVSSELRYGRAIGSAAASSTWDDIAGGMLLGEDDPSSFNRYFDPTERGYVNYTQTTASNIESHRIVDFLVGRDVGLGASAAGGSSVASLGLRYVRLKSASDVLMHGRPDTYFPPEDIVKYGGHMHRFHADVEARRTFEGVGLAAQWDGAIKLWGDAEAAGRIDADLGFGGAVIWGKQKTNLQGNIHGDYTAGVFGFANSHGGRYYLSQYSTDLDESRSKSVTVPSLNASAGLSYELGRTRVSGGYRWERYFDAIDGGTFEHKDFDRTIEGLYFKVAVGFGDQ